jgi:uncharacterized OsmC-like protein
MSQLDAYLAHKREALGQRRAREAAYGLGPSLLQARVRAEGRSGIRRIRIRDHQLISDSGLDYAGFDLAPNSPELQLGVLGSCLTHVFLIKAADRGVPLDSLETEVSGRMDPRAGWPGYEHIPAHPYDISYIVRVTSPATAEEIAALHTAVESACPILNLLVNPQRIKGALEYTTRAAHEPARSDE